MLLSVLEVLVSILEVLVSVFEVLVSVPEVLASDLEVLVEVGMSTAVVFLPLGSVNGNEILVGKTEIVVPFPGVGSREGIEIEVGTKIEIVLEPVIGRLVMVVLRSGTPVGRIEKIEEVKEDSSEVGLIGRVPFVSTGSAVSVVNVGMLDKILVKIGTLLVLLIGSSSVPVGNTVAREETISVSDGKTDCKVEETPETSTIGTVPISQSVKDGNIKIARR